MIKLTKRLSAVAGFAADGINIADIGTDHAYIPVYLVQNGKAKRVIASDIGTGPIERAKLSAKIYNVEDKIEFVVADGLSGTDTSFDTIIIAGMGGDTMISILSDALWAVSSTHLVLQPQTKIAKLVKWLNCKGCQIDNARLVKDTGKMYLVLSARYSGEIKDLSEGECLVVKPLFINKDPLLGEYLNGVKQKLELKINGMSESNSNVEEQKRNAELTLEEINEMIGEVEKW